MPWTDEQRRAMSEKKRAQYAADPSLRSRVSAATRAGMSRPEARAKYEAGITARDQSGERNPFFGKKHTEETKKKISENEERASKISVKRTEWWSSRLGQSVEQLFGEETGKRLRQQKSVRMSGERNPSFGKVYESSAGCLLGRYKGHFFRGILEYSFWKHLEKSGVDLTAVQYEPLRIPYRLNERNRTYTPDFLVGNELIEVKPKFIVEKNDETFRAKRGAAEQECVSRGWRYEVKTEEDFEMLPYRAVRSDPDVEWIRGGPTT